jgi:hypothetical protein
MESKNNNNKFEVTVGLKVKELSSGRTAKITGVYPNDDEVWMVSGSDIGVVRLSQFCDLFKKVK